MNIRETSDYQTIAKLNETVHQLHRQLHPDIFAEYNPEKALDFFESIVDKPEFTFLLVEENEQPAGFAWIEQRTYPGIAYLETYHSIYVHQISIENAYQNKGFGSRLMEEIFNRAASEGINRVELDYWTANESAKTFYHHKGFQPYRETVYKQL
ncbi:GNAT family N-acetyltransferase [Virgibacillus senegalensis]|uniref:GNAT family N-acetyltransferase n=1 Tax=Virgibacillus senegalensis TaxID=1499679 RepID=UPI00069FF93F|nr:GNAT family N-acetyltransferase [Virgibacillus senegalensis]